MFTRLQTDVRSPVNAAPNRAVEIATFDVMDDVSYRVLAWDFSDSVFVDVDSVSVVMAALNFDETALSEAIPSASP